MAGIKISQLPAIATSPGTAPLLTDIFPEVQPAVGGTTYQTTFQQLLTLFMPNITQLGTQSQALNMGTHLINGVVDPVSAQDAATKNYVDQTALNGTSVYAASAASLGTVTQAGAGPGATLTNAGAQATFALDGVNPPVGSNVLIKNTATGMSAANEGIYTVTNAGSGATNWVLTRATSFDTATEINNTGLIVVQNGSTLAGTAWYNAATIVTVDTTNFSFSRFGNSNAINSINIVEISATGSNTYTPSAQMKFATVYLVGPGGGSGGTASGVSTAGSSGGGGGGGVVIKTYTAALLGANATVVLGTGGIAGTAGNNAGGNGSVNSTFTPAGAGAILTAGLGSGGGSAAATGTTSQAQGGAGGTASGGDLNIPGSQGGVGIVLLGSAGQGFGGTGGATGLSTPLVAGNYQPTGIAGQNYGSGAAGAINSTAANVAGQAGANGFCYIIEYISA